MECGKSVSCAFPFPEGCPAPGQYCVVIEYVRVGERNRVVMVDSLCCGDEPVEWNPD